MHPTDRFTPDAPTWRAARTVVLVGFGLMLIGLLVRPDAALRVFWGVIVPLLPALFLVDARLWRNVCPLATLNLLSGSRADGGRQTGRMVRVSGAVGIATLALVVPARHLGLDDDPEALFCVLLLMSALALWAGTQIRMKGGFCNAICPILPVERLYGRDPALALPNARCSSCEACSLACLDLNPAGSPRSLVRGAANRPWLSTPFGAFVAAFPGFVAAYFTKPDAWTGPAAAYGWAAALSICSWSLFRATLGRRADTFDLGMLVSSVVAASTYFWFVPAQVATEFELGSTFVVVSRTAAVALIGHAALRARRSRRFAR